MFKIFWCETCQSHQLNAQGIVKHFAFLVAENTREGFYSFAGDSIDVDESELIDIVCPDCGNAVMVREFSRDDCPHIWRTYEYWYKRRCVICQRVQQAELVFPGEEE